MAAENDSLTKGQKTQKLIVSAALKLFGIHGFNQTSIQMIAEACDLSQGAVMQHFKSKTRLLEAVRSSVSKSNHDFIDGKITMIDDGLVALRKHMKGNLEWALSHRAEAQIIYLTYETGMYDEDQRQAACAAARLGSERILRYLYSAQREKLIKPTENLETCAQLFQEFLLGLLLRSLNETTSNKVPKSSFDRIDALINSFLNS